jgi:hypothetical protein
MENYVIQDEEESAQGGTGWLEKLTTLWEKRSWLQFLRQHREILLRDGVKGGREIGRRIPSCVQQNSKLSNEGDKNTDPLNLNLSYLCIESNLCSVGISLGHGKCSINESISKLREAIVASVEGSVYDKKTISIKNW